MFIKRVQEKQDALKQHSLLSQHILPHHSFHFSEHILSWGHPTSTLFHIHLRATGLLQSLYSHHNRTLISFSRPTANEWLDRQVRTLTDNAHKAGEWRAAHRSCRPPHVFFQLIEDDSPASTQRERIRDAGAKVKLIFLAWLSQSQDIY